MSVTTNHRLQRKRESYEIRKRQEMKARLITLLCERDPDFKFELACCGINDIMSRYRYKHLKVRLARIDNAKVPGHVLITWIG
jgi:hypothetical protein